MRVELPDHVSIGASKMNGCEHLRDVLTRDRRA